jgi:hypothetical protein
MFFSKLAKITLCGVSSPLALPWNLFMPLKLHNSQNLTPIHNKISYREKLGH